ncbi:hypothetical protein EW146_g1758 [Bondarzewia mesenterica]|uniref:Nucleolar protein 2 n=1 Tax=Bondarzewia mesenterica TaxID=1095465 RepID=A0A4V3XFY9_9AGAM|nr:hypothetical protein EW146_g1758 [Bondarzewia mesenterica]
MGRRAKNKQGNPEPISPLYENAKPSQKKLGKRKAEPETHESRRPAKKAKEAAGKGKVVAKGKELKQKSKGGKASGKDVEDAEEGGSSEGWEDADLKTEAISLFNNSDDEGLDELENDEFDLEDEDLLRGPVQELDLGSDVSHDDPAIPASKLKSKRSKQADRPTKIIPNASDASSDEDGDDDGPVTLANMEARSRALDARAAREAELDVEELQRAAEMVEGDDEFDGVDDMDDEEEDEAGGVSGEGFVLPSVEEREEEKKTGGTEVHVLQRRMRECVKVLGRWKKLGENTGRSRSEYVDQLVSDIASYYGYNDFLAEKLFQLFPVTEAIEFFEANEVPRPVTIRTNTLRTRRRDLAQALVNRGVNLEPIGKWTNVGLQVFESTVPIGATPEYLAGHYMLQAASSFLPVIALSPQPQERVLDMASAPGGKTTHIAALLQNTGVVFANDANKARTKSLTANVHRLGAKNVVVCSYDGREFPKVMGGFDRVLLDAPCSGTGVISKDSSVKVNKVGFPQTFHDHFHDLIIDVQISRYVQSERDFTLLSHLQKQLILCAIDSINPASKTGGYIVYSTCSVTVDENEAVVDYALRKRPNVHLVDTGLEFGREGYTRYRGKTFDDSVKLTRRFYPHVHNMDGFFVAKFKVERRTKGKKDEENEKGAVASKMEVDEEEMTEEVKFDEEEDRPYLEEAKRHRMKAKGLRVPPRNRAPAATTVKASA